MTSPELEEQEKIWNAAKPFPSWPWVQPYKRDIDRTLLRKNLAMSMEERCQQLASMAALVDQMQKSGVLSGQRLNKRMGSGK